MGDGDQVKWALCGHSDWAQHSSPCSVKHMLVYTFFQSLKHILVLLVYIIKTYSFRPSFKGIRWHGCVSDRSSQHESLREAQLSSIGLLWLVSIDKKSTMC